MREAARLATRASLASPARLAAPRNLRVPATARPTYTRRANHPQKREKAAGEAALFSDEWSEEKSLERLEE